jgi:hypothetical protein
MPKAKMLPKEMCIELLDQGSFGFVAKITAADTGSRRDFCMLAYRNTIRDIRQYANHVARILDCKVIDNCTAEER